MIKQRFLWVLVAAFLLLVFQMCSSPQQKTNAVKEGNVLTFYEGKPYQDVEYFSEAFDTKRNYRVYLPKNYDESKKYPVVYYFHGWSGRYKWDAYGLEDDVYYPENGRMEPPYVMEWKAYVQNHEVIIVTWDGYVPIHEGVKEREGLKYGQSSPYDCQQAYGRYSGKSERMGWDFSKYFRELVKNVDEHYSTINDRDHRAITGLSMGGQTALYIAGQNKDLVSAVSAFDPADNAPLYGVNNSQVVYPILQMYRSLIGLSVRLTATDGDWLKYNDEELRRLLKVAGVNRFEYHVATFPDHWAGDIDKQLDFHMKEFSKKHPFPNNWSNATPGFPDFSVWDYNFQINRSVPAFTILEDVSTNYLKILDRSFLPDGNIVAGEGVSITTAKLYKPSSEYKLISFNLSGSEFSSQDIKSDTEGRLSIKRDGGGNSIGINDLKSGKEAIVRLIPKGQQEYFYFETGKSYSFNFDLINVGLATAKNIEIRAFSKQDYLEFDKNKMQLKVLQSSSVKELNKQFKFHITSHDEANSVGRIYFEIKVDGAVADTQSILFFSIPQSPYIMAKDIIILDGRTVNNVAVFSQEANEVRHESISGGMGNGDGNIDRGEKILAYIRLPKGMSEADLNTFHRTYLLNQFDDEYIKVDTLDYTEKIGQAGATSIAAVIGVNERTPDKHLFDLWFQVESLYNDENDTLSRATIYARKYNYRRIKIKLDK